MDTPPVSLIPTPGLARPVRIAHVTDAHIGKFAQDDPNAAALHKRMETLRKQWGHDFESGLEHVLNQAWKERIDAIFFTGDVIDFAAPPSIEFARNLFLRSPCPIFFIAGNHDWNFPRQRGSNIVRASRRPLLAPLFLDGTVIDCASRDLNGLQILSVDNSTYQIDAKQLALVRQGLATGCPTVLLMHIPITQPLLKERAIAADVSPPMGEEMEEAARQVWGAEPAAPETAEFINLLRAAPNLHAIFCGHSHFGHEERFSPTTMQYVGAPAYERGIRFFKFQPA